VLFRPWFRDIDVSPRGRERHDIVASATSPAGARRGEILEADTHKDVATEPDRNPGGCERIAGRDGVRPPTLARRGQYDRRVGRRPSEDRAEERQPDINRRTLTGYSVPLHRSSSGPGRPTVHRPGPCFRRRVSTECRRRGRPPAWTVAVPPEPRCG